MSLALRAHESIVAGLTALRYDTRRRVETSSLCWLFEHNNTNAGFMRIAIKLGDELKYLLFDWPLAVAEPKPAGSRRNRLLSKEIREDGSQLLFVISHPTIELEQAFGARSIYRLLER